MEQANRTKSAYKHIASIHQDYTTPSRVLQSFTNLSNTVIQTALSGQSKFVFELLQNADDAFVDENKPIEVQFILDDNYLIVQHNGKGFDYNDVERICDYASQIEEVKATDLSKTGYKGLGFKSLFNLSDSIYIHSNGYSFRFDKTFWPDPQNKPWQVIPVWCTKLPLSHKYLYDKPVNFILKVGSVAQLEQQLNELVARPDLLLFLHRISKLKISISGVKYYLERKIEKIGLFNKVNFFINGDVTSTWVLRTFKQEVPKNIQNFVSGGSKYIFPDKIKKAQEVIFTFALKTDENLKEISKVKGLCYCTLPTQLSIFLPYHTNSFFILNLDRTQLHENEWNDFLIFQIAHLQFCLLRDLAEMPYLKNYVIELFVREIKHPYKAFNRSFSESFNTSVKKIGWLPPYQGSRLLRLGEAWTDDIEFFKQNFQNIKDPEVYPYLIDYNVKGQGNLFAAEVRHFTYDHLFKDFERKYYPQLTKDSYINFISYLYEALKKPSSQMANKLKHVSFLVSKNRMLICPKNALLEEHANPIPDFLLLNPVDNKFLPANETDAIKKWLVRLGARILMTPNEVLHESVFKWISSGEFDVIISIRNHVGIINYIANCFEMLTRKEFGILQQNLLVYTENNQPELAKNCYLPDAIPIKELADIISSNVKVSSSYDISSLRKFFVNVGVCGEMSPFEVISKSILIWIRNKELKFRLTKDNYGPIIEYCATHYPTMENCFSSCDRNELKKFLVLTASGALQMAGACFFDHAIPKINGLQYAFAADKSVSTKNISPEVYQFLSKIGVRKEIAPAEIIRRSVIRWIQEKDIATRITIDNHRHILLYISTQWATLTSGLKDNERNTLKEIPVLTENGTFKAANKCFWAPSHSDRSNSEEIPNLESIISKDEFVSSDYSEEIQVILKILGVRYLCFYEVYEKYSSHLKCAENANWFFSKLVYYWKRSKDGTQMKNLLQYLGKKFRSSRSLLARNERTYCSTDLYVSQFEIMHGINSDCVPLLAFRGLPGELENSFGFKKNLDLKCIKQLLKTLERNNSALGDGTCTFFKMILEQLKQINKSEIRKAQLHLMSKENRLRPAKDLYYFQEEDATCILDSCYLKRIQGMSHSETLELAELCGVTVLPFKEEVLQDNETYDSSLKEFYLTRLPCIVLQESKELNEPVTVTLKRLYDNLCSMKLFRCSNIFIKYPFGEPVCTRFHSDGKVLNVIGKWSNFLNKTKVSRHMKKILDLKTDITEILDMDPSSESDIQEWLAVSKMKPQTLAFIREELKKLSVDKVSNLISLESLKECLSLNIESQNVSSDEESSVENSSDDESEEKIEIKENRETRNNSLDDALKISIIDPSVLEKRKKSIDSPEVPPSNNITVMLPFLSNDFPSLMGEKPCIKWLSEKFVFTYLQNHYKNKYPKAVVSALNGNFTLKCQQMNVEIIWSNKSGDSKGLSYDLLVKKEGTIKQIVQVKPVDETNRDVFSSVHHQFVRKINQLISDFPRYQEKYCIYHVYTAGVSVANVQDLSKVATIYKTVMLKN